MPRPPSSPRAIPSFSLAALSLASSLLLRPLVWLAACALLGVMVGGHSAHLWQGLARDEAPLWHLLPFLLAALGMAWQLRRSPWLSRLGLAFGVLTFFAGHTARRLLPPRHDISRVFASPPKRDQPLRISPVRLVGIIGDYPQRSRWNTRFPLDVETANGNAATGQIWVSASYNSRLEIGDRIELRTDVRPLHRPHNPGEREAFWTAIGKRCWCESGPLLELSILNPGVSYRLERRIQAIRRSLLAR
ncbi:DUF4131 domain-containing protein, partial [bacterium]